MRERKLTNQRQQKKLTQQHSYDNYLKILKDGIIEVTMSYDN